jgi:hypothetical protein
MMKKSMLLFLVLLISLPSFARLKEKHVIGTWKYKVETDQGDLTGSIKIEKKDGLLVGEVHTDDGETFPVNKLEIMEDDTFYMEIYTGSDTLEISVTVKKKVFNGTVSTPEVSFPITADKIE